MIPGKGGRHGMKKLYTIPAYIVDGLEEKGLLPLIEDINEQPQGGIAPSESYIYI